MNLGWRLGVHKAVLSGLFSFACPLQDVASPLNPVKASHPLCICTAFVGMLPKWRPQTLSPSILVSQPTVRGVQGLSQLL